MRILLTGADGQVGYELLVRLAGLVDVIATTRSGRLPDARSCVALDLRDSSALRAIVMESSPDLVINAAAYTAVDRAEQEREDAFAVNAAAPATLAQACAQRGIRLVHLSTDYVFPGNGSRPLTEGDPVGPVSIYGETKLAGEEAVRASGASHKIFRLCWVYGVRGRNFLRTMLRLAAERDELRVVVDQMGCPTPARWIADALSQAIERNPEVSGTWHLCASGSTSWHGFATAIIEESVRSGLVTRKVQVTAIPSTEYPTPARRPAYSVLDCTRLDRDFGIRLADWRQGVRETVAALQGTKLT